MNRNKTMMFRDVGFHYSNTVNMKTIASLLILGLLLDGCYSSKSIIGRRTSEQYLSEINAFVNDKTAQVQLISGEIFTAKSIIIKQDSTFWQDSKAGFPLSVETSHIKNISIKRRQAANALKGLGGGFAIGAVTGGTLILLIGVDDCTGEDQICIERGSQQVAEGARLLGVPFGLIGLVTGALTKTSLNYQFEQAKTER